MDQALLGNSCNLAPETLLQYPLFLITIFYFSGLAVEIFESKFDCPSMGDILENTAVNGFQQGFLQNLPSVLCGHVLDPQPEEIILGEISVFSIVAILYSGAILIGFL